MRFLRSTIILISLFFYILSCKKDDKTTNDFINTDFRTNFIGEYSGLYTYSHSAPSRVNDTLWQIISTDTSYTIDVSVSMEGGSSVKVFSAGTMESVIKLQDASSGLEDNGAGSSYKRVSIEFRNDSLIFHKLQKCGIPCSQAWSVHAKKL